MPRYRSKASVEMKINQLTEKIEKTKNRLNRMENELKQLIEDRDKAEARALYAAFKRSNKTYEQTMTFLGVSVRKNSL